MATIHSIVRVLIVALACCLPAANADLDAATLQRLQDIIGGDHRSAANVRRDSWRHPVATLAFFGIRDNMTVVEMWPGSGRYYTEILAPLLRDNGTYYAFRNVHNFTINGYVEDFFAACGHFDLVDRCLRIVKW